MLRCACASEVYGSRFCECVCVLLVSPKLLKTKHWYVERKFKSTISRFLICQNVKNGCVFVMFMICSPRYIAHPDSCKGYPVYNRLISTLVFHLYHEHDGNAQEILIALLSKLSLLWRACYYMKVRHDLLTCSLYYIICLYTLKPQSDRCLLCLPFTCMQLQKCAL